LKDLADRELLTDSGKLLPTSGEETGIPVISSQTFIAFNLLQTTLKQ